MAQRTAHFSDLTGAYVPDEELVTVTMEVSRTEARERRLKTLDGSAPRATRRPAAQRSTQRRKLSARMPVEERAPLVLELFKGNASGTALTATEIQKKLKTNPDTARRTVKWMVENGQLRSIGKRQGSRGTKPDEYLPL